ncbi:MAG: hypothetical protein ABIB61_03970 [Candidatus Shapirobacteria bacterium]
MDDEKLTLRKPICSLGALIGVLLMAFSAPVSYLIGYMYWPAFDSFREMSGISHFVEGVIWQAAVLLLAAVLAVIGFSVWTFCRKQARISRTYLWISVAFGFLATLVNMLLFTILALLYMVPFLGDGVQRTLSPGLEFTINLLLLALLFLGNAALAARITLYHRRSLLSYPRGKVSNTR